MENRDLMLLLLGGLGFLFLLAFGAAMVCTDLGAGMFFYYQDGWICSMRTDRRLAEDTPANRRRVSRGVGLFFIVLDCVVFGTLALTRL